MQGAEAIDLTVGDHFVYYAARLGDFSQSGIVALALFDHKKRGKKSAEGKR